MLFKVKIKSTAEEKIKMKKYYDCYVEVTLQLHSTCTRKRSSFKLQPNIKYEISHFHDRSTLLINSYSNTASGKSLHIFTQRMILF